MRLHHVVFCVRPENQDHAAELWRDLGLTFMEVDLDDLGLRVLIDWEAGIEVVAPTGPGDSIVMSVSEVSGPTEIAARYGAPVRYEQRREHGGLRIDEVSLEPVHGMAVTFLATEATG